MENSSLTLDPSSCKWQVVSTSVAGTSHEKRSQPCQDAHQWEVLSDSILVAAIADGAGSAVLGEVGSQIAVSTSVAALRQHKLIDTPDKDDGQWQQLLSDVLKAAHAQVEAEAALREVKVRDLASTLIVLVATPELVAVVQVGDGAAVVGDRDGNIIALTSPPLSEYINETIFLISEQAMETAQFKVWRGRAAHLAVFSDGLQLLALKMPEATPHAPFFAPLFRFVGEVQDETEAKQQLESFLRSPRVTERTDDDLTLLLASLSN